MHAGLPTVQTITCLLSCGLFNQGWLPCKCRTNKSQGSSRTSKQVWLISSSTDLSRGRPALPEARAWRLRTDRLTRNAPVSLTSWLRGGQGVSATICRRLTRSARSKHTDSVKVHRLFWPEKLWHACIHMFKRRCKLRMLLHLAQCSPSGPGGRRFSSAQTFLPWCIDMFRDSVKLASLHSRMIIHLHSYLQCFEPTALSQKPVISLLVTLACMQLCLARDVCSFA